MAEPGMVETLLVLQPQLSHMVIVGGAAHRLFHLHELGRELEDSLLTTEDIDFAVPLELAHDGSNELLERLDAAGFEEQVEGASYAAHRYRREQANQPYLQFIAPLRGGGKSLNKPSAKSMKFSGVTAEKLRSVDLLLYKPWELPMSEGDLECTVRLVNPIAYVAQKILILPERRLAKQGKDLLYMHDTLAIFADALDELGASAQQMLPELTKKQRNGLQQRAQSFAMQLGDPLREAARIAESVPGRTPLPAEAMAVAMRVALPRFLASLELQF